MKTIKSDTGVFSNLPLAVDSLHAGAKPPSFRIWYPIDPGTIAKTR